MNVTFYKGKYPFNYAYINTLSTYDSNKRERKYAGVGKALINALGIKDICMIILNPLSSKSISFYEHIGFKNLTRINPRLGDVKEHVMYKFTVNFEKDDTILQLHRILSNYSWFGDGFLAMAVIEHAKFINSDICSRINGKTCMDLARDNPKVDIDVIDAINARCPQGGSKSRHKASPRYQRGID